MAAPADFAAERADRLEHWLQRDVESPIDEVLRAPWEHLFHQRKGPKGVRRTELDRLHNAAAAEDRVRNDYAGRSVIELLQNAHDACADAGTVGQAWIALTPSALIVANQGAPFDRKRVHSLIQLGDSSKAPGDSRHHTIGYKGVGFTAVLELTDRPQVFSRDTSFAFDRAIAAAKVSEVLDLDPRGVPLRYFPTPLDRDELGEDAAVIDRLMQAGAVTAIRLPLRDEDAARTARQQLTEGLRAETLLFMPSLKRLTVQLPESEHEWSRRAGRATGSLGTLTHLRSSHGTAGSWLLARRRVSVPAEVLHRLDDPLWSDVSDVEATVAVPWHNGRPDPDRMSQPIHVYFPTDDRLGRSVLVHGDFYMQSSRRRVTTEGPGQGITALVADAAADLVASLAVELRDHGNDLVRMLAPREAPDGFGVELANSIDERLAAAEFLPAAVPGKYLTPRDARTAGGGMRRRDRTQLVTLLESRLDVVRPDVAEGCEDWLRSLGVVPLGVDEVVARLEPARAPGYSALLSTLASWYELLDRNGQLACRQLLPRHAVLQDDQGQWTRPDGLMSVDSRTPRLPPSLARATYAPPGSEKARSFADAVLPVRTLTPRDALVDVLALVVKAPSDKEVPGVLDFLEASWRLDPTAVRDASSTALGRVPVPAKKIGSRARPGFAPAGTLYFTRDWTHSRTLETLYGPFGRLEFLDVKPGAARIGSERTFWAALGVAETPRRLPINELVLASPWWRLAEVEQAKECPDGHPYTTREAVGTAVDRLEPLLERTDDRTRSALANYLLSLSAPLGDGTRIRCTHSAHVGSRRSSGEPVIGFQRWLLNERAWIPSEGGPTETRFRRPRELWTNVPRGAARKVLASPRLPTSVKGPKALDLESVQGATLERLEGALAEVRAAFPDLNDASAALREGLEWLLRKIDQAAMRAKSRGHREIDWPALQDGASVWSASPLIGDLPGVDRVPGVACLPRAPWSGLQEHYGLRRASDAVRATVESTSPQRGLVLTPDGRVELLALLVSAGRAGDARSLAFRLAKLEEARAASLSVTYELDGHTWRDTPAFHLAEQRDSRKHLIGGRLVTTIGINGAQLLELAQELAHYLGQADAADTIGLYLTMGSAMLASHQIINSQLDEARDLLRRHPRYGVADDGAEPFVPPEGPRSTDLQESPRQQGQESDSPGLTDAEAGLGSEAPGAAGPRGGPASTGGSRSTSTTPTGHAEVHSAATGSGPHPPIHEMTFGEPTRVSERGATGPRASRAGRPRTGDRPGAGTSGRLSDAAVARRKETGSDAEDIATRFLELNHGAVVEKVGELNLGWDVTATLPDGVVWHVEVKGFSGTSPDFVITRNELLTARTDPAYRICIVAEVAERSGYLAWIEDTEDLLAADYLDPLQWSVLRWNRVEPLRFPWSRDHG